MSRFFISNGLCLIPIKNWTEYIIRIKWADNQRVLDEREIEFKKQSAVTKRYELLHQKNEEAISFQEDVLGRLHHIDGVFVNFDVLQMFNEVYGIIDEYGGKVAPYLENLVIANDLLETYPKKRIQDALEAVEDSQMAGVIESLRAERDERIRSPALGVQSRINSTQAQIQRLDGQIAGNQKVLDEREIDIKKQSEVTKRYELLHQRNEEAVSFQEDVLGRLRLINEGFIHSNVLEVFNEVAGIIDEYEGKVAPYLEQPPHVEPPHLSAHQEDEHHHQGPALKKPKH